MIIHFPIALLMVGFLLEITGLFSNNKFYKNATFYLQLLTNTGHIFLYLIGKSIIENNLDLKQILRKPL